MDEYRAEIEACLWCGKPTDQRIGGPSGQRSTRAGSEAEPWHLACFAERQAWDMAVSADMRLADGQEADDEMGTTIALGQLWLGLAAALRPPTS